MKDIDLYDEHVRGTAREVITVETRIKSSNKGFAMLAKMGWTEGKPVGVSGDGTSRLKTDFLSHDLKRVRESRPRSVRPEVRSVRTGEVSTGF